MNPIKPTVTLKEEGTCHEKELHEHPAFGCVTVSRISHGGQGCSMFGSEIRHDTTMRLKVTTAKKDRHLHRDWIHGDGWPYVEFSFTEAQWATFVSSAGMGCGTPCTISMIRDGKYVEVPGIQWGESKKAEFQREIHKRASKAMEDVTAAIAALEALTTGASVSKVALKKITHDLKCAAGNIPGNMKFVQESFVEAMEATVEDAKAVIEAFAQTTAMRIGTDNLQIDVPRPVMQIEHKE